MKPIKPMDPMPISMVERLKNNNIIQAWLVLTLALCFGTALAGVQLTLGPTIEENKINETREKVPELVLGAEAAQKMAEQNQALEIIPLSIGVEKEGRQKLYSVYEAKLEGKLAGWVAKTSGQGYADKIDLLVGFDPEIKAITGLFILEQKETPGLGANITTDVWRNQFVNKETAQPLAVVKKGAQASNEVDAITGATISSKSVTNIINTTVEDLRGRLVEKISSNAS